MLHLRDGSLVQTDTTQLQSILLCTAFLPKNCIAVEATHAPLALRRGLQVARKRKLILTLLLYFVDATGSHRQIGLLILRALSGTSQTTEPLRFWIKVTHRMVHLLLDVDVFAWHCAIGFMNGLLRLNIPLYNEVLVDHLIEVDLGTLVHGLLFGQAVPPQ